MNKQDKTTGLATRPGAGSGAHEVAHAAAVAFMQKGYEATSIDDVADVLGATKGRIYHYYRKKGDLYRDVLFLGMEMVLHEIRPIVERDELPADRLHAMAVRHARLMMESLPFMRVAIDALKSPTRRQQPPDSMESVNAMRDEYEELFVEVLRDGIKGGDFADRDPRLTVKAILGALNWIAIWYRPTEDPSADEPIATQFADFIVAGVRT